jgi:hypothetical protein
MATIATTTNGTPFQYPGQTLLVKIPPENSYICLVKASTADNYVFYKSTDGGGTWATLATVVRTNIVDIGQIFGDGYGWLWWVYRTNESSQDRIYLRNLNTHDGTNVNSSETLLDNPGNGGVAGSYYSGMDLRSFYGAISKHTVLVAVGTNVGANQGVTLLAAQWPLTSSDAHFTVTPNLISGTRQWLHAGTAGRVGPAIDGEHIGDGYTGALNLWVAYGRTHLKLVKLAWNGSGWSGTPGETTIYANVGNVNQISAAWSGSQFYVAVPDPVSTQQVMLIERDRANSTTVIHRTGNHTTGVVRTAIMAYDPNNRNVRVWAVGTSTAVLYANDWTRLADTWSGWGTTGFTILGAGADNYGAKHSSYGDAKWGLYTAASGSPNTLTYTPVALAYSPNQPWWSSPPNGAAVDVGLPVRLDWVFSDPDPGDTQGSYAVSRQIGAGALNYWRASDSTWQVAEVQNTSTSDLLFVPAGWAAATDAVYTFKVKVWDSSGLPSVYSSGLMIVPSTPVNPAVTAPTANQVIGTGTLAVAWTTTEQTGYRIQLDKSGVLDTFARTTANGWGTADSGQTWTTTNGVAADYSTNSSVGVHSNGTLNVLRTTVLDVGNPDQDLTIDCIINKATPTTAPITQRVCARYADGNNHYIAQLVLTTGGAVTLQLLKKVAGVLSGDLATSVTLQGSGHASGDAWRVRVQVVGSAVRAKAWLATVSEPPGWYHDVTDTDLTVGTQIAVISRVDTGNTDALPITTNYDNLYCVPGTWPDYDSNWVDDASARAVTPSVLLLNGDAWVLSLRTRNVEGLESTSQRVYFTVNFTPPATPTVVVTPMTSLGINRVVITNPTPGGAQPPVASQDLYRRVVGDTSNGGRIATLLANNATYDDFKVTSGVAYEYRVCTIGTTGVIVFGAWTA